MKSMLKSLMSVAVAALALTSCSNDATEEVTIKGKPKTLEVNATIDQTRTTLDATNHVNLKWSDGDEIHLYVGADATEEEVINLTIGEKITTEYVGGETVYAYYSTKVNNQPSQGVQKVLLNIPSKQTQEAADVFAGVNLPMAAKGTIQDGKVTLAFKPLGCVLVFNVYGPDTSEKIESIKFDTEVGCCGYDNKRCNLTAEKVQYKAYENGKTATVTLQNGAAIGASKPGDSQIGNRNQVYLVVAPVNYPAGSKFTITTQSKKTYTFTTKNGIDCSGVSARVVNINLANAVEMQPAIVVPDVPQQSSDAGSLVINDIVFKNITEEQIANAAVGVFSDEELTQLDNSWLTISSTANLASGQLTCTVSENTTTASRTAYIGIECADVTAVIPVMQVGKGSKPVSTASLTLEDIAKLNLISNSYKSFEITAADGSAWSGFSAGTADYLQLGWETNTDKNASKSHVLVPNADKVIKKIIFKQHSRTGNGRVLVLLPDNFEYEGQTANEVKQAAYAVSDKTVNGTTTTISIDLTNQNLKRFMIRAVGGAVSLSDITIEYAE